MNKKIKNVICTGCFKKLKTFEITVMCKSCLTLIQINDLKIWNCIKCDKIIYSSRHPPWYKCIDGWCKCEVKENGNV